MSRANLTEKTCSRCKAVKPVSEFRRARTRDGLYAYCRPCCAAHQREYRQRNLERMRQYDTDRRRRDPEKYQARDRERWQGDRKQRSNEQRFARKVFTKYSLTLDEYDALVNAPCQMCGDTKDIVLDHCHNTGQLRGPLCKWCNLGLGYFKDDPARLRAAADYIEQHRKGRRWQRDDSDQERLS